MKKLPPKVVSLCLLLAGTVCSGTELTTKENVVFRPSEWAAVSDDQLGNMRGGFDGGTGLMVSFGIVRTVMINGDLMSRTSFNLPDVTQITPEQARMASAAIDNVALVQNGPGNFVSAGLTASLSSGTAIQNSLDNQRIQSLTVINTGVNSLGLFKAINTQTVLKDALLGAMGIR